MKAVFVTVTVQRTDWIEQRLRNRQILASSGVIRVSRPPGYDEVITIVTAAQMNTNESLVAGQGIVT